MSYASMAASNTLNLLKLVTIAVRPLKAASNSRPESIPRGAPIRILFHLLDCSNSYPFCLSIFLPAWILYPYLLPLQHDVANAIHDIAGAVGEAMEVLSAGYTAEDQHGFDLRFEARNDIGVHAIPYDDCLFAPAAQPF